MRKLFVLAGAVSLAACGTADTGEAETETEVAEAEAPVEAASFNETNWTFTRDGADFIESIDASGNYIANVGDEHSDHGTYEFLDGKHCFTSAMTDEGQVCWTAPATVAVGETVEVVNDAGETLTVTRQEYAPLTM